MSQDVTPEWVRMKREMESLWQGAWDAVHELWDHVSRLEKRVEKLERQAERSDSRPLRFSISSVDRRPLDED